MKKPLITFIFLIVSAAVMAQTNTRVSAKTHGLKLNVPPKDSLKIDTVYTLPYDKNINMLYDLLSAGYNGVSSSPHYSKDQADAYKEKFMHLDSIFRPQIIKLHPAVKPKKP